jgi:transcriptional regulator with XRE-family HTH domain
MQTEILRKWLRDTLKRKKLSQRALARHMELDDSEISRFLSGARKHLTLEEINLAQDFLNEDLPEDLFANKKLYVKKAPLRGTIAAGILRAIEMSAPAYVGNIPYLPTSIYSEYEQYAYQLMDDHAEDYAPTHAFVIFIDFAAVRDVPRNGDIVRIEEKHTISGRTKNREIIEGTLRRVEVTRNGTILRKLSSTNPNVQDIPFDPNDKRTFIRDLAIGYFTLNSEEPSVKV